MPLNDSQTHTILSQSIAKWNQVLFEVEGQQGQSISSEPLVLTFSKIFQWFSLDCDNCSKFKVGSIENYQKKFMNPEDILVEMRQRMAKSLPLETKKPEFIFTDQPIRYQRRCKNQLKHETLQKQLIKKTNAAVFEFSATREKTSACSVSQLADAVKSAGQIRKLCIQWAHDLDAKIGLNNRSYLHQSLKCLYSLQTLNITLRGESDAGLRYLGQSLKALTSLQNFTLSIESGFSWDLSFSDTGLYYLSRGIKRLSMLKKLNLSGRYLAKVTDIGLKYISQSLRRLTCLEGIRLSFASSKKMTDTGLSHLSKSLGKLCLLKSFRFEMSHSQNITDEGLKSLSKSLEMCVSLEYVYLDFKECPEITNEGFNCISRALKKHIYMKDLEMDFLGCIKITDEAVHNFSEILMTFVSLKNMEFCITDCPQVTKKEFEFMGETIEKYTSRVIARLYFPNGLNRTIFPNMKKLEELKQKVFDLECGLEEFKEEEKEDEDEEDDLREETLEKS